MAETENILERFGCNEMVYNMAQPFIDSGFEPARVVSETKRHYLVQTEKGPAVMEAPGKFYFLMKDDRDLPAVGDWVVIRRIDSQTTLLHAILPRSSLLCRKAAGKRMEPQVIAANVDMVFILAGLDQRINPRRLQRYLVMVAESGSRPALLFSKKDLLTEEEQTERLMQGKQVAEDAPILIYSANDAQDLQSIMSWIAPGQTVCFLGPSGVGKSTLINKLLGEEKLATRKVRSKDAKGRHTTTQRQLFLLPNAGLVIDTPGMRELGLFDLGGGIEDTFADLEEMADQCRFRDCSHQQEPGCAVRQAVELKEIVIERYQSFVKLTNERKNEQTDPVMLQQKRKQREKTFSRAASQFYKDKKGKI